jgi:hypothetical protein
MEDGFYEGESHQLWKIQAVGGGLSAENYRRGKRRTLRGAYSGITLAIIILTPIARRCAFVTALRNDVVQRESKVPE